LGFSFISITGIILALEVDNFATASAETGGTVIQGENHVSWGLGGVDTSFSGVRRSEINIDSGEVGVINGSETF